MNQELTPAEFLKTAIYPDLDKALIEVCQKSSRIFLTLTISSLLNTFRKPM